MSTIQPNTNIIVTSLFSTIYIINVGRDHVERGTGGTFSFLIKIFITIKFVIYESF